MSVMFGKKDVCFLTVSGSVWPVHAHRTLVCGARQGEYVRRDQADWAFRYNAVVSSGHNGGYKLLRVVLPPTREECCEEMRTERRTEDADVPTLRNCGLYIEIPPHEPRVVSTASIV